MKTTGNLFQVMIDSKIIRKQKSNLNSKKKGTSKGYSCDYIVFVARNQWIMKNNEELITVMMKIDATGIVLK